MKHQNEIILKNTRCLNQGISLLKQINDGLYRKAAGPFSSSVGQHIRHVFDHYDSFLAGLPTQCIDYDHRQRKTRIELEREYAIQKLDEVKQSVETLPSEMFEAELQIRIDYDSHNGRHSFMSSTMNRELAFLMSHTFHHYALIRFILDIQKFCPTLCDFGIAPSTLKYERSRSKCAPLPG